jgi:acyl-CoA synthetase (AMP-forming)/AMP-acid ligase II
MRLGDIISAHALHRPKKTALVCPDRYVTYSELESRSQRLAEWLLKEGVGPGDRVAVLEKTSLECVMATLAVLKCGAVLIPINNLLRPGELAYIVSDCQPSVLLHGEDYRQLAEEATEGLSRPPDTLSIPSWEEVTTLPGISGKKDHVPTPPSAQQTCIMLYTSGTTGVPKAAMYSHEGFVQNILSTVIDTHIQGYDEVWLGPIPLYHIGGLGTLMRGLAMSNTLVLKERFDPEAHLETVQREGVTILYAYPTMINAMVQVLQHHGFDLSTLKLVIYGGSPISMALLREAYHRFGCDFLQRYGLTECSGAAISVLSPHHHRNAVHDPVRWGVKLESVGLPALGVMVRLEDDLGNTVQKPNTPAEIVARLPHPMLGYWNKDEETEETLRDGWLYTGDIGIIDDDGFIYLVDRKKDMIISGARNIYPREVEGVIQQHPAVMEVAVIGVPDDYWGESVKAYVVLRPGTKATEEEIIAFCKERLASYKKPRSVEFVDSLPKNPGGKTLKRELRERNWKGLERRVH